MRVKEEHCFVLPRPEPAGAAAAAASARAAFGFDAPVDYELPDGQVLELGSELHEAPELLFAPGGGGGGDGGGGESLALPELVSTALHSCAATGDEGDASWDIKRQLLQGLVIAGGGSMLAGIEGRLEYELRHRSACRIPLKEAVRVLAPSARDESAWRGGAVLANLSTFGELWVTREEYEEHGAGVVRRKCYN
jgi:actin-related protein